MSLARTGRTSADSARSVPARTIGRQLAWNVSYVFMGTAASTVPASAKCQFDEGYGRYTPCSALYKSKKCFIDEGNGRYTPCSALVKNRKKG
jgi:hypothetical protein